MHCGFLPEHLNYGKKWKMNNQLGSHYFPVRVYYEDTDLAGIVYYANYLKFIERARSTLIREIGIDQIFLHEQGITFAVRKVEADYLFGASLDNELLIETRLSRLSGARIIFKQDIYNDKKLIFSSLITIVCLNKFGSATRIPKAVFVALQKFSA